MDNIILIGMPGVGKSTLGSALAEKLKYDFIDTDILIEEKAGKSIPQIIKENGIDKIMQIENEVNTNIKVEKSIIATGGSVVYGKTAMCNLKKIGKIIYLKQDFETINKRIENVEERGVILKKNQTLKDLYNERTPLYEKYADIIIEEGELSIEETLQVLLNTLANNMFKINQ